MTHVDSKNNKHLGFSGTRAGMTAAQKAMVATILPRFRVLHHGDCVGADVQAHELARELSLEVQVHPPISEQWRAHCQGDQSHPPRHHLVRNRDIVACTAELLAAPKGFAEDRRSGTWATVRYAREARRRVTIV